MNKRIRELREILGMSRAAFGEMLGVSGDVINNMERGRIEIKDDRVKLICKIFEVNEEWLRNGTPPMKKSDIIDEYSEIATLIGEKDPKAKQAIMDYWKLTDADKDLFWKFVDRFILNKGG